MTIFKPLGDATRFERLAERLTDDIALQRELQDFLRAVAYKSELEQPEEDAGTFIEHTDTPEEWPDAQYTHVPVTNANDPRALIWSPFQFLSLTDVEDEDYSGKAGYVPTVNAGETGLLLSAASGGSLDIYCVDLNINPLVTYNIQSTFTDVPFTRPTKCNPAGSSWLPTTPSTDIYLPSPGTYWYSFHVVYEIQITAPGTANYAAIAANLYEQPPGGNIDADNGAVDLNPILHGWELGLYTRSGLFQINEISPGVMPWIRLETIARNAAAPCYCDDVTAHFFKLNDRVDP